MKKLKSLLIPILVLSLLSFFVFWKMGKILSSRPGARAYSKQSLTAGVVEIETIPKQLSPGREMVFTLYLNNHSVELNYDYMKMVAVVDDNGNIYKPIKWTGGGGGHHVSGDLIFDKLSNKATKVGLNITGVDSKSVVFDWKL